MGFLRMDKKICNILPWRN